MVVEGRQGWRRPMPVDELSRLDRHQGRLLRANNSRTDRLNQEELVRARAAKVETVQRPLRIGDGR